MLKAVLFDVDGTLIDTNHLHASAWADTFREFGHAIDIEDIDRQIGKGGDELMPVFLSGDEVEARGKAIEKRYAAIFKERYLAQAKPFPHVPELFARLRRDGVRIALASSAKEDMLAEFKTIAGIDGLTDVETTSDDAEASKPNPDIFDAARERFGDVAREEAIVVGDTPYDAEAATKAGLRTIGLTCGGWSEAELKQAGCITVYRDPADLLANYEASPIASATKATDWISADRHRTAKN